MAFSIGQKIKELEKALDNLKLLQETGKLDAGATSDASQYSVNGLLGLDIPEGETIRVSPLASDEDAKEEEEIRKKLDMIFGSGNSAPPGTGYIGKEDLENDSRKDAKPKEEDSGWVESGAFEDGYQFGDVSRTIYGTARDVVDNAFGGILDIGEAVVDAGAYVVGGVGGLFSEDFKKDVQEFIAYDLYDGAEVAKKILNAVDPITGIFDLDNEANSVLGEKADDLIGSAGQLLGTIGLQAVGVPWWVTSGATSFGGETENAFNQGADYEEAGLSAAISAGAEILTEKLFGGSGLGEKGLVNVDKLTKRLSGTAVKALADFGIDMTTEGFEEVISQFFSNLGSALYREENLGEILFSEEAWYGYLDSFIGGLALSGSANVGKTANSIKTGRDYRTGLTKNEQKVFDSVYNERLEEAEKSGKELTKKDKAALYDEVMKDLEKGYISSDKIESILGGESYKTYQDTVANEDAILKEFAELGKIKKSDFTAAQDSRYNELEQLVKDIKDGNARNDLKTKLSTDVQKMLTETNSKGKVTRSDDFLLESYNEKARRGNVFEADLTKYKGKQQEVVKKAIESGILNNTNRAHELVDMIAKISADKGVLFDFTNNEKLKNSGFAVNGAAVNGYITKDGVTVNIDSKKSLNSIVGHEITHVLEGTDLYAELQKVLFDYAKTKNDYDGRRKAIEYLYKGIKDANVDAELTADLVGDYLFTDSDFVNHLSTKHRNVFQKIYDEIKYLFKAATKGSKEARELERVKRVFDKAYKESGKAQTEAKTENPSGVIKYSLDKNWDNSYNLYTTTDDFVRQVPSAMRHDFTRSLANKTSGMTEGETRTVYIYAGNVYAFRADGYMHGELVGSVTPTELKDKLASRKEYKNAIDTDTETANLWSKPIPDIGRGPGGDISVLEGRGRSTSNDTLSEDSSERYTARYTERERQTFETKEEIDDVVNKLREMYGLDAKESNGTFTETQSNEIAPINEASSADGVFFNGENSKYSLSSDVEAPIKRGNFNISENDVRIEAPIQDGIVENGTTTPTVSKMEQVTEDYAPITEKEANALQSETVDTLTDDYAPVADDIAPTAENESAPTQEHEDIKPKPEQLSSDEAERTANRMARADKAQKEPKGKRRKFVKSSVESDAVDGKILQDDLNQTKIFYQPISNKATLKDANTRLESMGYEASVTYFNSQFANKKTSLEDVVLGERLIQEAIKRGDNKTAGELIEDVAILGTELGQKVQALSIIKRLTPEGQLRMLKRTVERGKTKGDKTFDGVEITQEMIDHILNTYGKDGTVDQNKLNKAVEDVKKQIADQMKVTKMEKANAWRYLSMLGNPKTHIRNLVSNVAMRGTVAVKNAIARTAEGGTNTVAELLGFDAPIKNRTKTWKRATDEVKTFSQNTAIEMQDVLKDGGKYNEEASIKEKRDVFKNKILNGVYKFNNDLLTKEDWWFSRPAFTNALSEYLTANGIETQQDIENNPEIVNKAKQYATEQSQIATFRQYSWLANKINDIEKHNTATNIAVGAVLPFKKTPINIAKTALNYSPLGFVKSLTYDVSQVKNGKMEASQLIDNLSQNVTGSALTLVGYLLASAGFINGAGEDDKEGSYDYQLGEQSYSINIGGATYSLSWLSPIAMPLFVGANAYEQLVEGKEWNRDVVVETLAQTLDPLSEMSFLSSLDSVLSSYDSGIQKFAGIGQSMAENYITQFVPTLSSQVASVLDDTKRTTKVAGDSDFKFFDEVINDLKYKIPFLRETLEPTTDIWGNDVKQSENLFTRAFENFIAPYAKRDNLASKVDEEIKSLYGETGDTGIIPSIPNNYINYDGGKYEMSAEDYTAYKQTYGQTAFDMLEELFRTNTYQNAGSDERADMVNAVYDYARDEAKREYFAKYGVDFTNATAEGKEYYKENSIKGAIENDMTPDEYEFSTDNPEKYKFLNDNGVTYDDYKNGSGDFKDAWSWAYNNPEKYTLSKAVSSDLVTYRKYTKDLYDIKEDKDENGKSISGSRKKKVIDYINNLEADYGEKIILFKSVYNADNTYNYDILEYLNSRDDLSYEERVTILKELGFTISSDGSTASW